MQNDCGRGLSWRTADDAQHACLCHWMAESARNASAAARLLKAREAELPGTVVLLFQPAEEGGAGGKRFVEAGALEGVLGVHGIHVWPGIPAGIITSRVTPASQALIPCFSKPEACLRCMLASKVLDKTIRNRQSIERAIGLRVIDYGAALLR